jgi:CheY-like chemotaxis protein
MTTVLIVDDEAAVSELLSELLHDIGYTVVAAPNGQRALDLLGQMPEPPALVLTDIMMPLLGGVELARAIKSSPATSRVPVILMSAAPFDGDAPADAFVGKPFDIDVLVALLLEYLPTTHNET